MAYKQINSKVCVSHVLNNYNITQLGWITRSPEWINMAMGLMSIYTRTSYAEPKDVTVASYKAQLPCDIKLLLAIEYEGYRLHCITSPTNTLDAVDLALQDHSVEFYELDNNGNIILSFEEGTIRIHYKMLPIELDTDLNIWFPLIPDSEEIIDAIEQYILYRILTKGFKIPELSLRDKNPFTNPGLAWAEKKKAAENSEVINDINELHEISKITRTFLYDNNVYDNRDFNNTKSY